MHDVTDYTEKQEILTTWFWILESPANQTQETQAQEITAKPKNRKFRFAPLKPIKQWLENLQINTPNLAHRLCQLIPAQCPFERDVNILGKTLFHIPPLCKLNPFYEQLVMLRFRALCYLADECGEDISAYC